MITSIAFAVAAAASSDGGDGGDGRDVMQLHMMTDRGLKTDGAVCLDGSDAG